MVEEYFSEAIVGLLSTSLTYAAFVGKKTIASLLKALDSFNQLCEAQTIALMETSEHQKAMKITAKKVATDVAAIRKNTAPLAIVASG